MSPETFSSHTYCIPTGAQIFDLAFHPTNAVVYTALMSGHVKGFAYNAGTKRRRIQDHPSSSGEGSAQVEMHHTLVLKVRPSHKSCRSVSVNADGSNMYAVGKSKGLSTIDTATSQHSTRTNAHDAPINRVKSLLPWLLATGDDEGAVKLWDPRQQPCVRTYTQHSDYITDFLWLEDKRQLVSTSGDGTLSVMDVRSKAPKPVAQSEDQEDELLSITAINGGQKIVVGTQLGTMSVFNRNSGWGDSVDRIPGHPMSIDAICTVPSDVLGVDGTNTILTGSSDGYVRAVRILPTKLLGVVANHGELPVERIAVSDGTCRELRLNDNDNDDDDDDDDAARNREQTRICTRQDSDNDSLSAGVGKWWAGSVGHEDVLHMTDLASFFCTQLDEEGGDDGDAADTVIVEGGEVQEPQANVQPEETDEASQEDEAGDRPVIRKRVPKNSLAVKRKKGDDVIVDAAFFDGL